MELKRFLSLSLLQTGWAALLQDRQNNAIICSAASSQVGINASSSDMWPWQVYKSSNVTPPALLINSTGEALYDGLVLFTAQNGPILGEKQQAPFIMTDQGDLVWSGPDDSTSNFRVQTLNDEPVISFWSGRGTTGTRGVAGHGYGEVVIMDTSYNTIHRVCPKVKINLPPGASAECNIDPHESYITPRNTMLVTAYNTTRANLTSVGGPEHAWVLDCLALEVNITSGDVLFSWSALEHVPLNGSHQPIAGAGTNASNPWDFFHINAIQPVGDNYLINSRHFWATYLVSAKGETIWQINGDDGGDFGPLPEGGRFSWQHFARIEQVNSSTALLHWFANNNGLTGVDPEPSKGLSLLLTMPPNKKSPPKLITNVTDPADFLASYSQGSFQYLPNGNYLMAYGSNAVLAEFGPISESNSTTGTVRWTAQVGHGTLVSVYRGYKSTWHATPASPPQLVVRDAGDGDALVLCAGNSTSRGYVSWNGATDVTDWVLYTGSNRTDLSPVGQVRKAGFETQFAVPVGAKFVQVGAIENDSGSVVRRSNVVSVS